MVGSHRMERSETPSHILSTLAVGCSYLLLGLAVAAMPLHGQTLPGATPGAAAGQPARPTTPPPEAPSPQELMAPPASATRLPSGISTRLLRAGSGKISPRLQDFIFFHALGRRPDGTVVQNTFASGDPTRIQLSKLLPTWQQALSGMVPGEQRRFWFPVELAPKNPATGVQEAVIFDIELVKVGRTPDPPSALKAPDPQAKAVGLKPGVSALTVKAGKTGPKATRRDAALMSFSVWNDLGQLLASSSVEGRSTLFPLDRVMTAFADCVEGMTVGEVRHCWVTAERNEGFPGAGRGALVFELELLNLADAAKIFTPGATKPN